ncbi:spore germination protein, partial [Heyndrickxia coagulans]|uniref:spore germination protein n=2 Tax=Heyndrickxia TaxID=2837504 RepID=UPI003D20C735
FNFAINIYFLNQGRIAILLEGSPFAALLPTVMVNMMQAAEYLNQGSIIPLFVRLIRLVSLLLALYAPSLFVALLSVNTGIIPENLGLVIASDRATVPYPFLVEVLALFVLLDIFLESTAFVPGVIGPALNIVGSLVIGQAAAQAHLVSRTSINVN